MHQPTLRVLKVLEKICEDSSGKTLTDFSRELGIPKSTLSPILQSLCESRYLFYSPDLKKYIPGAALFSLGAHFAGCFPILEYIRKILKELVAQWNETCYFGVLEEGNVLYLAKEESSEPLRMLTATGSRMPAYATGIGKALLMDRTEAELKELYPEGLTALTPHTLRSVSDLAAQLCRARAEGYAWETEESTAFIRCLAVPVRRNGAIAGAISMAIPVFRWKEENQEKILSCLQQAARQLGNTIAETNSHFGNIF